MSSFLLQGIPRHPDTRLFEVREAFKRTLFLLLVVFRSYIRAYMWIPGYRPNRRMDIVQRKSHHSPRLWISVSYCTTVVTHIPGLLVVVSSDMVP